MRTVQVIELFHQKKSWNGPTVYIFYKEKGKKKLRIEKKRDSHFAVDVKIYAFSCCIFLCSFSYSSFKHRVCADLVMKI